MCAFHRKTQKLRKLFRGGAGWSEPSLKWAEIHLAEKLKRTKQKETCHIWEVERGLLELRMLTEVPTEFQCIPKALGEH